MLAGTREVDHLQSWLQNTEDFVDQRWVAVLVAEKLDIQTLVCPPELEKEVLDGSILCTRSERTGLLAGFSLLSTRENERFEI